MKKDVYGLSRPQESIWLTEQYFKDDNINRIISLIDFSSKIKELDFELLNKALNNMVRQNDNFQIRLFLENGEVKQHFCEFEEFKCEVFEVNSAEEFAEQNSREQDVFNLIESPLYKFKLFRIKGTNTGGILSNIHHIICDGYATGLAMRQTYESYMSLVEKNELPDLNPEKYSYKEYLETEKEYARQ